MVHNNHSKLLRAEGRYDEAEEKLYRALEIWSAALGPEQFLVDRPPPSRRSLVAERAGDGSEPPATSRSAVSRRPLDLTLAERRMMLLGLLGQRWSGRPAEDLADLACPGGA